MFGLELWQFLAVVAITVFAGFVKGALGFAMPMIMMSGFSSVLPATVALAAMILPTLLTNVQQAFREGGDAAFASIRKFRLHIAMVVIFICVSAGFATTIPQWLMYALLGGPIILFALWQLSGRPLTLNLRHRRRAEGISGIVGGFYGGISGIWGPPLIVYLLSIGVSMREQMRVQGVVFLIGAISLLVAHMFSGVLNAQTLSLSAALCIPSFIGMNLGFILHDRLDVGQFRRWTLLLLILTGLNLLRRALELWSL